MRKRSESVHDFRRTGMYFESRLRRFWPSEPWSVCLAWLWHLLYIVRAQCSPSSTFPSPLHSRTPGS